MGISFSNRNSNATLPAKSIIQTPISLTSCITSRYLGYNETRYLARDPFSCNFFISSPALRETYLLSQSGKVSKLKHKISPSLGIGNPYMFRPTLSICILSSSPLILISNQRHVTVCNMDGDLVTNIAYRTLGNEEQLIAACADSMECIYMLTQVIRHGAVRGEVTEISCQLTRNEKFHFGADHIEVARDMCKRGNRLFILHESANCVLVFTLDGILLSALVSTLPSNFPNAVFNPMHMTVDSKQNMFISAWGEDTISLINSSGVIVAQIKPTIEVAFSKPSGLYLDELDHTLYCLTRGEQPQLISFAIPPLLRMF